MTDSLPHRPAEQAYVDNFAPATDWLTELRAAALARFKPHGLPHRRMEAWRWSDLDRHLRQAYPPAPEDIIIGNAAGMDAALSETLAAQAQVTLVFVNGRFSAEHSRLPSVDGLTITPLQDAAPEMADRVRPSLDRDDALDMLNLAYASSGALIHITPTEGGKAREIAIALVFIADTSQAVTIFTRNVVSLADGASARLTETHLGATGGNYVHNTVTEARLGKGARLSRIKLQKESPQACHLAGFRAGLKARAVLDDFVLTRGARFSRHNGNVLFRGPHGQAELSGVSLLDKQQHCDTCLTIDHAVPNCKSRELFKCVMNDDARGVFQGKVIVRPDAQNTDGKQSSHGLLLSPSAEFDAKPELEIYADDVVCGHGATSGALNEDMLFYLRARGIPPAQAKALLVAAFAGEALDLIADEIIRKQLTDLVERWLQP